MIIVCSTKICHKVAFNAIHSKKRILKVNSKTPIKLWKDLPKVNQNLKATWQTLLWYPCCEIWTGLTLNAMLVVHTLNRNLCGGLTFSKLSKMLGETKRSILIVNLKKYPRQIQHPITELKMATLSPAHLFAIRGRWKRGPETLQTCD